MFGLWLEAGPVPELTPRGEWPRLSMSAESSGTAARNRLIDPTKIPFLGQGLPELLLIVFRWTAAVEC